VCNGVIFPDGKIAGVALKWVDMPKENVHRIEVVRTNDMRVSLDRDTPDVVWTVISGMYQIRDYVRNLVVECGESGINGGHGYVAVADLREDEFRWIVYLCDSNPFSHCELEDKAVVATSTLGIRLRLPIDRPQDVRVLSKTIEL
jgi:hypothetical protein